MRQQKETFPSVKNRKNHSTIRVWCFLQNAVDLRHSLNALLVGMSITKTVKSKIIEKVVFNQTRLLITIPSLVTGYLSGRK